MTTEIQLQDDHCKVFVGNLPFDVTDDVLSAFFSVTGKVKSANVIRRGRRSLGYGFVTFETESDAVSSHKELNKKVFNDREINVELAKARVLHPEGQVRKPRPAFPDHSGIPRRGRRGPPRHPVSERKDATPSATSLFVANLPFAMKDKDLANVFTGYKVAKAHVVVMRNGRSKGYGFVEFETEAEQQKALLHMTNAIVEDRPLVVKIALDLPEKTEAEA